MKRFSSDCSGVETGFGLVETIVGSAIVLVVLLGMVQIAQFTFRVVDDSSFKLRAGFLAEEGLEAVRTLRDTSWSVTITPLLLATDYSLTFSTSTNEWSVGTALAPLTDGIFDRRIRFSAVYRSSSDAIVASTTTGATLDPNTREVSVTVSWTNRGQTSTATLATYLTNFFDN